MDKNDIILPDKIGRYKIVRSLGKGGMGEVFLAYDPSCKRHVALKQMRKELSQNSILQQRFLREALTAAHLSHPSIIPIHEIHQEEKLVYYTMPYVEGETLKQILKRAYEEEKEGEIRHPIGISIPLLAQIYLKVCEAIAFAHAKGILHRDLKPDNIIVGKYGEVLLFDWGLAGVIGEDKKEEFAVESGQTDSDLTKPGKVAGTLPFLSPERVLGQRASTSFDIYALGVMLYQILTLRLPFHRQSIKHFRKTMHLERLLDPLEVAPYRDIPDHLADVAKRCLRFEPTERFQSVDEIINELKSYVEGRPEWIPSGELQMDRKEDWEFQENILLSKHIAITRSPDIMEWVSLMVSRASFPGNLRLDVRVEAHADCAGIGFIIGIPNALERKGFLDEGYLLWLGSEREAGLRLIQCNVEVMNVPDFSLKTAKAHLLRIELIDNHLYFYCDGQLLCHTISHVPLRGTHLGLCLRDADFEMQAIQVALGSRSAMVKCLAIPDAFLANKNFKKALVEYRNIASSFPGRTEGREALFRAGVTLLEEGSSQKHRRHRAKLYAMALDEFGKLRFTPSAPLEFLGKSLVYKAMGEREEEIKCLELALRKYAKHPTMRVIIEHITIRLHESAARNRIAAYEFALLCLRHLPHIFQADDNKRLLESLKKNLETLPFLHPCLDSTQENLHLSIQLSFWLGKPSPLIEMIEQELPAPLALNAYLALATLGFDKWIQENLHFYPDPELLKLTLSGPKSLAALLSRFADPAARKCTYCLIDRSLTAGTSHRLLPMLDQLPPLPADEQMHMDAQLIAVYLSNHKWKAAGDLISKYPEEILASEFSPLYPLMGCWLRHSESKEIALSHFSSDLSLPYPPTPMLLSYFLRRRIDERTGWIQRAFPWEKILLYRQLALFYNAAADQSRAQQFLTKSKRELKHVHTKHSYP